MQPHLTWLFPLVIFAEIVGGIMLIVGFHIRLAVPSLFVIYYSRCRIAGRRERHRLQYEAIKSLLSPHGHRALDVSVSFWVAGVGLSELVKGY